MFAVWRPTCGVWCLKFSDYSLMFDFDVRYLTFSWRTHDIDIKMTLTWHTSDINILADTYSSLDRNRYDEYSSSKR